MLKVLYTYGSSPSRRNSPTPNNQLVPGTFKPGTMSRGERHTAVSSRVRSPGGVQPRRRQVQNPQIASVINNARVMDKTRTCAPSSPSVCAPRRPARSEFILLVRLQSLTIHWNCYATSSNVITPPRIPIFRWFFTVKRQNNTWK